MPTRKKIDTYNNMDAYLGTAFSHYLVIGIAVLGLVAYHQLSKRVTWLPKLPLKLILFYFALRLLSISLPKDLNHQAQRIILVATAVVLYCALASFTFSLIVESWYKFKKRAKVPKITRDLVLLISYAVIFLIVLRTKGGVNLIGLITTSAVLTAVIGLAAQNVLGNLLAGLSIQIEHPFCIGDWIQYHDHIGKVMNIGWEATRLKTFDDETIIIPNLDISKSVICNYSIPTPRHAMRIEVGIEYGAPPGKVREVLLDICEKEPRILKDPKPAIRVLNFGDFAITYQVRFFYEDYGTSPYLKADIKDRIWYALRRNGIHIPFPIRDVHHRHIERRFEEKEQDALRAEAAKNIEKVPILAPLSGNAKAAIAKGMVVEGYGDGEVIVRQGDAGDSLYIVYSGACDVEISSATGSISKVATLLPPAFFGEMSLLTGEPRSATVRAHGDTTVFSIGKALFRGVLVNQPEVSEELARVLASRQADTADIVGRLEEEQERRASRLLARIKTFFGMS